MSVCRKRFGMTRQGEIIDEFSIANRGGYGIRVITYGAALTSITVPDRTGGTRDVCLGFSSPEVYEGDENGCAGAVIGRVGGRIAGASFELEGKKYCLTANNGPNTLHSGNRGFDKRVWSGAAADDHTVCLHLLSEDGDQGFPGNLQVDVSYSFSDENVLRIEYRAVTDHITPCDITNHCYFNLNGHNRSTILDHSLRVYAEKYLVTGTDLIPTGEFRPTADVPFGFTQSIPVGRAIDCSSADENIAFHKGIDTNYCLDRKDGLCRAAQLSSEDSGVIMDVFTDQPSIHVYTGMCLDFPGKDGAYYHPYSGIAMLTEHYPDSIHHPSFPSYILTPDRRYRSVTEYRFSVKP